MREKAKAVLVKHIKGKNADQRIEACLDELMPVVENVKPTGPKQAFGVVMTQKAAEDHPTKGFNGRPQVV